MIEGVQGYDAVGADRLAAWDAVPVEAAPEPALAMLSGPAGQALDIGAGSGRVSAWLAARGWRVDAVEPMAAFRAHAEAAHRSDAIRWIDGGLPDLAGLDAGTYQLAVCFAVLAHLDADARTASLARIGGLLAPGGRLVVSLRIGDGPKGRRHYPIDAEDFAAAAAEAGLERVFQTEADSLQAENRRSGVRWLWFGFTR
ncbi:MAG: class I SAM-dependent methyltransferase [Oceanicaulis sp.]